MRRSRNHSGPSLVTLKAGGPARRWRLPLNKKPSPRLMSQISTRSLLFRSPLAKPHAMEKTSIGLLHPRHATCRVTRGLLALHGSTLPRQYPLWNGNRLANWQFEIMKQKPWAISLSALETQSSSTATSTLAALDAPMRRITGQKTGERMSWAGFQIWRVNVATSE